MLPLAFYASRLSRVPSLTAALVVPLSWPSLLTPASRVLAIKGRWMETFGFDTGKLAIITVKHGRMVIELDINI
ncbi:type I toxin-antitoxin system toxin SymE [Erwinia rhapontici]|nr:type I toxin-antitoxin system toxin SymE [Erwinia rhapontici]